MLKRQKGFRRTNPIKARKALKSNIRPVKVERYRPEKPVKVQVVKAIDRESQWDGWFRYYRIRNPGLRATMRREWQDMVIFGETVTCGICDSPITNHSEVSLDHIIPRSLGGGDIETNMQPSHKLCNNAKGSNLNFKLPFPAQT